MKIKLLSIFLIAGLLSCKKNEESTPVDTAKQDVLKLIEADATVNKLNSVAFAVTKNDELLWADAVGFANKENKTKATADTPYLIASISKTVTAVALMQLFEQGKFQLDDDINGYLPFKVRNSMFPNDKITFKMLLTHSSSISDEHYNTLDFYTYGADNPLPLGEMMAGFYDKNGKYNSTENFSTKKPGSVIEYSNMGFALIGYLVENISKTPFDKYCNTNIFAKLGMNKTSWRLADFNKNQLAIPYSDPEFPTDLANPHYTFADFPNGGLRTTVVDLSKFLRAIINNGITQNANILKPQTVELMKTKNGQKLNNDDLGLCFYYTKVGNKEYFGHGGGEKGVNTNMLLDLNTKIGVIWFSNTNGTGIESNVAIAELMKYGASK